MSEFPKGWLKHCPKILEARDWVKTLNAPVLSEADFENFAECAFVSVDAGMACKACGKHLTRPFLHHKLDEEWLPQIEAYYESLKEPEPQEAGLDTIEQMIAEYGDRAYSEAVRRTHIGLTVDDLLGARHYADIGIELMQRGYHKK